MRRLLYTSLVIITSIILSACGDSSTGPDPGNEENNDVATYTVSVDVSPTDAGSVSPSMEATYEEGKEMQLLANPAEEYVFTGWTGDMEGKVNPLPLTVSQDFNITANFEIKSYDLSVDTEGEGSVTEQVLEQKAKEYEHGTVVELVATPAKGYRFVEWKGDLTGTDNPAQITVNDPKQVTAVFEKKSYALTVQTQGSGAVSERVVSKAKGYEYGDVVELSPNPAEGWRFVEWTGDLTGTENPAQITVDTTKTVTALFERKTFALNLNRTGNGSVAKAPDQAEYAYGSTVTLTAAPAEGWAFKEWGGEISGTYPEMEITVYSEKDLMAVFEEKSYDLMIHTEGKGSVAETDVQSKSYNHGTSVQLTAEPADSWRFVEWKGDVTGTDNPVQITVENPKEVTAVFEPLIYLAKNGKTVVCPEAEPGQKGILNGEDYGKEYVAVDSTMLYQRVDDEADVTNACTTHITNMDSLFVDKTSFNQDISAWDVSNVTNMSAMFRSAENFNSDISDWNVSNVADMSYMFSSAISFNGDISKWDVSGVTDMSHMFKSAESFNQDISNWNVSNVSDMSYIFSSAISFNRDIGSWNVSNVTNMSYMFSGAENFTGDISSWDVSSVTNMSGMFSSTILFDADLSSWDVSNVTDMSSMFSSANSFHADIDSWDVSNVTNMSSMFSGAVDFTAGISSWDVSSVTNMSSMFSSANAFNGYIGSWDVSNVTDMSSMFSNVRNFLYGDLSNWDLSSVTDMSGMFYDTGSVAGGISSWDVSNVTDMYGMFWGADNFNQDISSWDVSSVTGMSYMFYQASSFNQDISGWCVVNITSKPPLFDAAAAFDGQSSLQPQWGTCP